MKTMRNYQENSYQVLNNAALVAIETASNKLPPESKIIASIYIIHTILFGMIQNFFKSIVWLFFNILSINEANSLFKSCAPLPSNSGDADGQLIYF